MPYDRWAGSPEPVARRAGGYDLALDIAPREDDDGAWYDGIRLWVPALTSTDIAQAITADPDATGHHLHEALAIALDVAAPTVQAQLDEISDLLLEVL